MEDLREAEDRRRKSFPLVAAIVVVVAVAIAIVLAAAQLSSTRQGAFLDRLSAWRAADRSGVPVAHGVRPADSTRPARSGSGTGVVSTEESETSPPREAVEQTAVETTRAPSASSAMEAPLTSPLLPPRSRGTPPGAVGDEAPSRATPPALVPSAQTSEERMGTFLVERLGPGPAEEKARSNAAWYDADRSESAYWQRVAEAIRRRGER